MPKAKAPGAAAKKPRAPKGGHQLAEALPEGEILRDIVKGEWKLGKPIGSGGFGLIYLTDRASTGPVASNAGYVMKLEPHSNGPLFCELHFYQRAAKPDAIEQWMKEKKMKSLGVPKYIASGNHDRSGTKYRFLVMERFETDLQKLFEQNNKNFSDRSVYILGIKLLNALEYLHDKDYVHADVKASNLLTGRGKSDEVYLVDFGLAAKYASDGKHKEYKEDPRRVHDGTIEFTSRDAHKGVAPSRRGDLEILGYCMLQWMCGRLPWEDKLSNKEYVRDQKIKYMADVSSLVKKCLPGSNATDELVKFLQYTAKMKYEDRPDYDKCRQWFRQALKRLGHSETGRLDLAASNGTPAKRPLKRKGVASDSSSPSPVKQQRVTPGRKATPSSTPRPSAKRKATSATPKRQGNTPRVTDSGEIIPAPAVPPPALIAAAQHAVAKAKSQTKGAAAKRKKRLVDRMSAGTQTSPGLKGLKRSRKKKH